jgi:hypothetical protein
MRAPCWTSRTSNPDSSSCRTRGSSPIRSSPSTRNASKPSRRRPADYSPRRMRMRPMSGPLWPRSWHGSAPRTRPTWKAAHYIAGSSIRRSSSASASGEDSKVLGTALTPPSPTAGSPPFGQPVRRPAQEAVGRPGTLVGAPSIRRPQEKTPTPLLGARVCTWTVWLVRTKSGQRRPRNLLTRPPAGQTPRFSADSNLRTNWRMTLSGDGGNRTRVRDRVAVASTSVSGALISSSDRLAGGVSEDQLPEMSPAWRERTAPGNPTC